MPPMRAMWKSVTLDVGPKVYGRVRYRSRVGYRKYPRPIPGGLSAAEVFQESCRAELAKPSYLSLRMLP